MATLILKYYVTMPLNFFPEKCKKNSLKLVVIAYGFEVIIQVKV